MPEMSGIELACQIRKLDETVKIFLITAFELNDLNMDKGFTSAGIEMVIQKPVHLKNLKQHLNDSILQDNAKTTTTESYIQTLTPTF